MLPPANTVTTDPFVTGPQAHCNRRAYHRVRAISEDDAACEDCGLHGNRAWARKELRAEEDFLMILGKAIEDLGNKELRQRAQFRKAMDRLDG
jgi:hypothetical protein